MSANLKLLTISQSEKSDDSQLFVLNRIKPRGNINITVTLDGERRTVTIPIASCPIDITTMTTKKSMLSSPEFRRLHARGFIQIASTESAEELFMTDKKAQAELNRVYDALGTGDLGGVTPMIPEDSGVHVDNSTINDAENAVSPLVLSVVTRASGDENVEGLIQDLEAQMDVIANDELQYIVSNSTNSTLKEWASLALMEREEGEE